MIKDANIFVFAIDFIIGHEGCSRRVYFSLHPPLLSLAGKSSSSTILLIFISFTCQCHVMSNCFVLLNSRWSETIIAGSLSSHFAHTSSHRLLPLPRPDHPGRQDQHHDHHHDHNDHPGRQDSFSLFNDLYDGSIPQTVYNSCLGFDPQKEQHCKCIPCNSINSSNNNETWPNQVTVKSQNAFAFILFWLKISLSCSK